VHVCACTHAHHKHIQTHKGYANINHWSLQNAVLDEAVQLLMTCLTLNMQDKPWKVEAGGVSKLNSSRYKPSNFDSDNIQYPCGVVSYPPSGASLGSGAGNTL
jgi:hypothetical protein